MSERRRLHPVLAVSFVAGSALAVMGAAIVTACGSADLAATRSVGARPAGMTVATEPSAYTAGQLRAALLPAVDRARPAAPAEAGRYATLPDVQTSRQTMTGVTVTPARCAQATMTAFHAPAFAAAPAAVVTFLVGRDGVSEVLVSAPPRLAETALGGLLPAGCDRYTATVDGETFGYQAREVPLAGLAKQARALNVRAAGYAGVNVWSVVYRGGGFVGAITMVGPDVSEQAVERLAIQAYATADRVLSGS
jgi:hypothetical protein